MRNYKFVSATGGSHDEKILKLDFNTAKVVGNVRYGQQFLFYQGVPEWAYIDYKEIVWAYRRLEDVKGKLGRGNSGIELHSLMLVTKDKQRIGVLVGDRAHAAEGLNLIGQRNLLVDIGFSKEKEEKYV